jgi:hypothetical protein
MIAQATDFIARTLSRRLSCVPPGGKPRRNCDYECRKKNEACGHGITKTCSTTDNSSDHAMDANEMIAREAVRRGAMQPKPQYPFCSGWEETNEWLCSPARESQGLRKFVTVGAVPPLTQRATMVLFLRVETVRGSTMELRCPCRGFYSRSRGTARARHPASRQTVAAEFQRACDLGHQI